MNHPGTQALFKVYRISDIAIDDPGWAPARLAQHHPRPVAPVVRRRLQARDVLVSRAHPQRDPRVPSRDGSRVLRGRVLPRAREGRGLRNEHGEQRDWERPDDRSGKSKPIPDSTLERHSDEATIQEIGMVVYQRSFSPHDRGLLSAAGYLSGRPGASIHHRAVVMSARPARPRPSRLPRQTARNRPTSSPAGGGSIVVTAME